MGNILNFSLTFISIISILECLSTVNRKMCQSHPFHYVWTGFPLWRQRSGALSDSHLPCCRSSLCFYSADCWIATSFLRWTACPSLCHLFSLSQAEWVLSCCCCSSGLILLWKRCEKLISRYYKLIILCRLLQLINSISECCTHLPIHSEYLCLLHCLVWLKSPHSLHCCELHCSQGWWMASHLDHQQSPAKIPNISLIKALVGYNYTITQVWSPFISA